MSRASRVNVSAGLRTIGVLLLFGAAGAFAAAAAPASYPERTRAILESPPAGLSISASIEDRLFSLLNQLRKDEGLAALKPRAALRKAGRAHSYRMLRDDFFAHRDPDGRPVGHRIAAVDRRNLYQSVGENLAQISPPGDNTADEMHQGWTESAGHYENMISPDFTHAATGCAADGETVMCTQVFGRSAGRLKSALPLQLRQSGQTNVSAQIDGLDYAGWVLLNIRGKKRETGSGPLLKWPAGLTGEHRLRIVGERREGNKIYRYRFFAPSVVLE